MLLSYHSTVGFLSNSCCEAVILFRIGAFSFHLGRILILCALRDRREAPFPLADEVGIFAIVVTSGAIMACEAILVLQDQATILVCGATKLASRRDHAPTQLAAAYFLAGLTLSCIHIICGTLTRFGGFFCDGV